MLKTKVKYQHRDVQFSDINPVNHDIQPLLDFLRHYKTVNGLGLGKNNPQFHGSKQYHIIGNKMAKICKDAVLTNIATNILRYQYCNGADLSKYDLDFIEGVEDMCLKGKPFTRKQSWQLAMLLTDHCDF